MKKTNKLLTLALSTLLLAGCGGSNEHNWSDEWKSSASRHWRECNDEGCNEIKDSGSHTYGEFSIDAEANKKTRTCSVCGYVDKQDVTDEDIFTDGDIEDGNFTFHSDLATPQKIHTTDQENFLNYDGEYYSMTGSQLNTYHASGNAENSFPNQVKVTWDYEVPEGSTVSKYSIVTGQKSDLSDGYKIDGTTAKEISFYNAFLGNNYFKVIANFSDGSTEESDIHVFKVDGTAPRNLKVGTMSNCRDHGGRKNTLGGTIKQGLIYRTSDPATSGVGDVSEWTKRMGIKTEIYVKDGSNSSGPLGSTVKFVNASMDYGATPYSNMARNAERLRKVFSVLGDTNNYPLMYHCRIGTDRTGICGIAINGLLGISFNETIQDYAFSNFGKIDNQRYVGKTPDTNGDDIAKYVNEILAMPGETFQEQVIYSLLTIGIPASTLQTVIDYMTEGAKITIPTNITVANGDALTNNGGSKKTATDYKNPDTYYEISGTSQSVTCNYEASANKKVTVVCYLGCTDSSSSKKLANGIDLKIDGTSQTITNTKTYQLAGFGKTQQDKRTGYMYNILGEFDLTQGTHSITIAGKNSDKFYIGAISIIG